MKNQTKKASENDHFYKSEGYARFLKNDHFSVHSLSILVSFSKNELENEIQNEVKIAQKWLP
jgi:hypothetical protein